MMDKMLQIVIAVICVWLILFFLVPLLHGIVATVVTILVVLCAIVFLIKQAGLWF